MELKYENLELKDSYVCFIDILGFKNQIIEACQENLGNKLLKQLKKVMEEVSVLFDASKMPYHIPCRKYFTDNLVLGFPIFDNENKSELLRHAIMISGFYQYVFATHGFLVRGAITKGLNFMNEEMVFGPGIVEAYLMESKAVFPRIVLDQKLLNGLNQNMVSPAFNTLAYDEKTETVFIHYLSLVGGGCEGVISYVQNHREFIIKNIEKNRKDPKILTKYLWLAEYHNYFCEKNMGSDATLMINLEQWQCKFQSINHPLLQKLLESQA